MNVGASIHECIPTYVVDVSLTYLSLYRYEGLGIKEIKQFLDNEHQHVYLYLPEPKLELPKTPKQWVVNVCASVLKEKFTDWVKF